MLLNVSNEILDMYEKIHVLNFRKEALAKCLEHINAEDENTKFACLGPVNKVMNMVPPTHLIINDDHSIFHVVDLFSNKGKRLSAIQATSRTKQRFFMDD